MQKPIQPILEISNLSITFGNDDRKSVPVQSIHCTIPKGSISAIVGESGSGKTLTALSIMQLLPKQARCTGSIWFHEKDQVTDLLSLTPQQIRSYRGRKIAMIFQEPMNALNPMMTCGRQVAEMLILHKKMSAKKAKAATLKLFEEVELPDPSAIYKRYPNQISGGQQQRVMIAMAISCNPELLIADEPTTALDIQVQESILRLLIGLREKYQLSILFITHDLELVAQIADQLIVMYKGTIVECGQPKDIISNPQHPYSKALWQCLPKATWKGKRLPVLSDFMKDVENLESSVSIFEPLQPIAINESPILSVQSLTVEFPQKINFWGKILSTSKAVDEVSFNVYPQEILGLVGESGCGKTTLSRAILQLIQPTSGKILINGREVSSNSKSSLERSKEIQIVFQNPFGSLNPRLSIGEALTEPMLVHGLWGNKRQRKEKAAHLLEQVGLTPDQLRRYPHQFSGGQRQRICIARALALEPSFIIFDESVAALDVSIQAQILNLIMELRQHNRFAALFISHNLKVVYHLSDRIMVMQSGKIVESNTAEALYRDPVHPYSRALISLMQA